ncbi:hypothetical protein OUZ56_023911 [Daphnia magna]|uniref:Uncharacterized protein n=1 Tax=Daphnia magna TaxID=35525 RepID=A0ABR0AZT1_9CRUS|nr:hypothetical protein OUZ56_023911 [Daphnia magna]
MAGVTGHGWLPLVLVYDKLLVHVIACTTHADDQNMMLKYLIVKRPEKNRFFGRPYPVDWGNLLAQFQINEKFFICKTTYIFKGSEVQVPALICFYFTVN